MILPLRQSARILVQHIRLFSRNQENLSTIEKLLRNIDKDSH